MYDAGKALDVTILDGVGTASGNPLFTSDTGAPTTAAGAVGTGGSGLIGWLSYIWSRLANIASLTFTSGNLNVNVASGGSGTTYAATATAAVATAQATSVKSTAGRMYRAVVTAVGSANVGLNFTDGPSGNVIAVIPQNAPAGYVAVMPPNGTPFATSLLPTGATGSPAVTVDYS